ncbi:hypothetical protein P3W45_001106 [Vairimorpha bombi]|jgi:hypothetical protein
MFYSLLFYSYICELCCTNSLLSLQNIKKAEIEDRIKNRKNPSYNYKISENNINMIVDAIMDIKNNQDEVKYNINIGKYRANFDMLILQCRSLLRKRDNILKDIQDLKIKELSYRKDRLNIKYLNDIIVYLIVMLSRYIDVYTTLCDISIRSRLINVQKIKKSLARSRNMMKRFLNEQITKLRFLSGNNFVKKLLYTEDNLNIRNLIILANSLCIKAVKSIETSEKDDKLKT